MSGGGGGGQDVSQISTHLPDYALNTERANLGILLGTMFPGIQVPAAWYQGTGLNFPGANKQGRPGAGGGGIAGSAQAAGNPLFQIGGAFPTGTGQGAQTSGSAAFNPATGTSYGAPGTQALNPQFAQNFGQPMFAGSDYLMQLEQIMPGAAMAMFSPPAANQLYGSSALYGPAQGPSANQLIQSNPAYAALSNYFNTGMGAG